MSTSKTGKHGHAKVNLVGQDVRFPSLVPLIWCSLCFRSSPVKNMSVVFFNWTRLKDRSSIQEDMSPSTHNMEVPVVRRSEYPLVRPLLHTFHQQILHWWLRSIFRAILWPSWPQMAIRKRTLGYLRASSAHKFSQNLNLERSFLLPACLLWVWSKWVVISSQLWH